VSDEIRTKMLKAEGKITKFIATSTIHFQMVYNNALNEFLK